MNGETLICGCHDDGYDYAWYYEKPREYTELDTTRARRCASCKITMIKPGDTVLKFSRWRPTRNRMEERIHGDEIPLAPYYLCESCGDLWLSLTEIGYCIAPDENVPALIEELKKYKEVK